MKIKRNKLKEVFIIETTKKEMFILILLVIVIFFTCYVYLTFGNIWD